MSTTFKPIGAACPARACADLRSTGLYDVLSAPAVCMGVGGRPNEPDPVTTEITKRVETVDNDVMGVHLWLDGTFR